MNPRQAAKLLGGHATGTLTEEERRQLFAAALAHQEVFDSLMDEEALRELLADPAAKAQLLAALAPSGAPRVVPFWRRTGLLSAAAGLIVAATAGLVYLRSPDKTPPSLQQAPAKVPEAKATQAMPGTPPALEPARKKSPAPPRPAAEMPPPPAPAPRPAPVAGAAAPLAEAYQAQAEARRAEAQDKVAKKAEALRSSAARMEAAPAQQARAAESRNAAAGAVPGGVIGGVVGGVVGGVAARATGTGPGEGARDAAARPSPPKPKAGPHASGGAVKAEVAPSWTVVPKPDGSTQVEVVTPSDGRVVLLLRGPMGVVALRPQAKEEVQAERLLWRWQVRLSTGDALDLYLLKAPVDDPTQLPETGPVEGFRARIHAPGK